MIDELVREKDKRHRRYNDAEIEIDRLKRENKAYELAIHRLIYERDCAIEDINNLANWVCDDDLYYLEFGENEQGEEVYISVTIKTKDGKYKEIWRGVKR